jgi:hypothetical protein
MKFEVITMELRDAWKTLSQRAKQEILERNGEMMRWMYEAPMVSDLKVDTIFDAVRTAKRGKK